ncbi:hypothetical protein LTR37_015292 [Vermiconidia calcicola]|uniref:Uncharacterized protein n=1 Tax=Vermiconidia calcicola TaxID=1690605 RepID=A0ACC3MSA9_9PEZI|nr:hypothetical protein LTR37_015292 [Vermiconidia calcicola]
MSGTSDTGIERVPVEEIFTSGLLEYAHNITFPWDLDKPLNASTVGPAIFGARHTIADWDVPLVKNALTRLALLKIDDIRLEDFPGFIRAASEEDGELFAWQRFFGMVLILDQGSRFLCKGTNARYIYHFFDRIALATIKSMLSGGRSAALSDWEAAGIDKDQAGVRMLVLIAALAHSEDMEDQKMHLHAVARLRREYETLSKTHDPYRATLEQDCKDIHLQGRMLSEGPPQGKSVHMSDVVYWMMRYYASYVAYVDNFGRSPYRNVAVGRDDGEGEVEWLAENGVWRTEEDEQVREKIKQDIENGVWSPLYL